MRPDVGPPAVARRHPLQHLLPDRVVRPVLDRLVGRHLKIQSRDLRRAHAEQRKPALVVRIDELVGGRGRLGKNPEPAERVDAFVDGQHAVRNRRTADAVKSIAAGDEVAVNLVIGTAMP